MTPNVSTSSTSGSASSATFCSAALLPHLQIVDRVVNQFPVVNTALDFANQRYAALKQSNSLVSSTLNRAESTVQYVVTSTVVPVVNRLEQPIHYADNIAVQGFDKVQAKIDSLSKSGEEIAANTISAVVGTAERLQEVKKQAVAKVHSVLALPTNVIPLVDNLLNAGENVLDYLLPAQQLKQATKNGGSPVLAKGGKDQQSGTAGNVENDEDENGGKRLKTVVRIIFVRARQFTDEVQRRLVDYSREKWIPAIIESIIVVKHNVLQNGLNAVDKARRLIGPAPGSTNTTTASTSVKTVANNAVAQSTPSTSSSSSTTTTPNNPQQSSTTPVTSTSAVVVNNTITTSKKGNKNANTNATSSSASASSSTSSSSNGDVKSRSENENDGKEGKESS